MLAMGFKRQADQYPLFQSCYEGLKAAGFQFPEAATKYCDCFIISISPAPAAARPTAPETPQRAPARAPERGAHPD